MKKNTYDTKLFLQKALQSMPDDFSLLEVRDLIKSTLAKLEYVESKRKKRQENKEKKEQVFVNPGLTLQALNKEIEKTKFNLHEIKNRKQTIEKDLDDGLQSLFG